MSEYVLGWAALGVVTVALSWHTERKVGLVRTSFLGDALVLVGWPVMLPLLIGVLYEDWALEREKRGRK